MVNHIETINKIIDENLNKQPREIARLINKYCSENSSINEVETRTLNKNIKLDGYNFAKTKNIVRIKAKSKNKTKEKLQEAESALIALQQAIEQLSELMKLVVEISHRLDDITP